MFKRKKEMQSLIDTSRKSLAEAEETIQKITEETKIARHNSVVALKRYKKANTTLQEIIKLTEINTYSNSELILCKIRELIADYQSNN